MLQKAILVLLFALFGIQLAQAQTGIAIECGTIIENEFTEQAQYQDYKITVAPGDILRISGTPLGDTLSINLALYDPTGILIDMTDKGISKSPVLETGILSARGTYTIAAGNATYNSVQKLEGRNFCTWDNRCLGGIGVYTLFVGCTLRDGTIIEPGEQTPDDVKSSSSPMVVAASAFSGTGFPGLGPVDFTNAFKLPLSLGTAMPGSIPPAGDAVLGLTFDGNQGDTFALDFARTAGNLNLGVVILSANNEVVFQASLVTSESLSTRLTLPSTGQYTIGVFRIDLLPPAAPEATQFQVTGTLNP